MVVNLAFLGCLLKDGNRNIFRVSLKSVTPLAVCTCTVDCSRPSTRIDCLPDEWKSKIMMRPWKRGCSTAPGENRDQRTGNRGERTGDREQGMKKSKQGPGNKKLGEGNRQRGREWEMRNGKWGTSNEEWGMEKGKRKGQMKMKMRNWGSRKWLTVSGK